MPKFKVYQFHIDGDKLAAARGLKDFDRIEFKYKESSGQVIIDYVHAVISDESSSVIDYVGGRNTDDSDDIKDLGQYLARPYKITKEMFDELANAHLPKKRLNKLTFVLQGKYVHTPGNSSPDADSNDNGKEFIKLKVKAFYEK